MWVFTNQRPYIRVTSQRVPSGLFNPYELASLEGFKPGLPAMVNNAHFDVQTIQLRMRPRLLTMASPGIPANKYLVRV